MNFKMSNPAPHLLALAMVVLAGCGPKEVEPATPIDGSVSNTPSAPAPEALPVETAPEAGNDRVCCESFGYGAMMVECCQHVEWTTTAGCTVPPGFVGGGKRTVDATRCETVK